jgi:hypothetical protein
VSIVAGPSSSNLQQSESFGELCYAASGGLRRQRQLQYPRPNQASKILSLA